MNIHSLAKTTPYQRQQIVYRVNCLGQRVSDVADSLAISVRTVFKWLRRFREEGPQGLFDRSSRPLRSPRRLAARLIAQIAALRRREHLRARWIAERLQLARSTVWRWLVRLGLRRLPAPPRPPVQRYEHPEPGALLHLDIKQLGRIRAPGHAVTGDRSRRSRGAGWERLHVCVDDHSRYALCTILPDERGQTAVEFLEHCLGQFRGLGVEVKAILTDNGACYRSRLFRQACTTAGLKQRFTRPYRPQTNGKAERFIRSTMEECLYASSFNNGAERKLALAAWLKYYNQQRPHGALNSHPPVSRLKPQL